MPDIQLELGKWKPAHVEALLREAAALRTPSDRLAHLMKKFIGTPFTYEAHLPVPATGKVRFRLESFDCFTFALNLLAMSGARTIPEVAERLAQLRYHRYESRGLDSHPSLGNIYGFGSEALLENAVERNLAKDITADVTDEKSAFVEITVDLRRVKRPALLDPEESWESPHYGEGRKTRRAFSAREAHALSSSRLQSGDLVLFSRGETLRDGSPNADFVDHLGVVEVEEGEVYFWHCSRHFVWWPEGAPLSSPYSGVFYGRDRKREALGVGPATIFVGNEVSRTEGADRLYGYEPYRKRPLADYLGENFKGAFFLRPT